MSKNEHLPEDLLDVSDNTQGRQEQQFLSIICILPALSLLAQDIDRCIMFSGCLDLNLLKTLHHIVRPSGAFKF